MRFLTAGESHGPQLTAIIEGVPSGFDISIDKINQALRDRQKGYGRGKRMNIEKDQVRILSGVRFGKTTGSPITLTIENKDYKNWENIMSVEKMDLEQFEEVKSKMITRPRPGHADLNGGIKYNHHDLRNVLERSSARETAIRVAVGALVKQLLTPFGITFISHVINIGGIRALSYEEIDNLSIDDITNRIELSEVRCIDLEISKSMKQEIDKAKKSGDTLGGIVEVVVLGLPIGLGSHVHWDRKLDGKLGQAILSIQAFKGVEIGIGFESANLPGSMVHDEIIWDDEYGFRRSTNRAGGLEGGMTTGEAIIVKGVMKPIPTLYKPLKSVDIDCKESFDAAIERSDTCAVPAASVVAEHAVAWEIADSFFNKFSGDSLFEVTNQYQNYIKQVRDF
ncbi:chorismate synthase [Vulcanibacillus modesticaldus]|uniref:Chorismate synthase n=1 Tax=Vulcanibacillus modesticaldus TaxID=337097 RepID=A0A1D2YTL7_9BACI|nr:chorismate synthase [Vulcanibacillus modesticaldus]OEF99027.1 chorismate synthase [Vulcanibacillus modesticaldus]